MSPPCRFWVLAALAGVACRKPPPAEIVFTGNAAALPGSASARSPTGGGREAPAGSAVAPGGAAQGSGTAPGASSGGAVPVAAEGPAAARCSAPEPAAEPFSKARLIEAAADCALWHYCEFEANAAALSAAAGRYQEDPTQARRVEVQQAFAFAMGRWQRAELFRFGPAARSTEPGGRDLRDLIYAWPVRPECKVDEQTVSQSYLSPEFLSLDFRASPVPGRTSSALEYLLFAEGYGNHCSPYAAINAGGAWAALSPEEITRRRRAYAERVALDVLARARELSSAWTGSDGFRTLLTSSGPANPVFASEQAVLNAVSNALFYLDLELKDLKLATPLGLTPECTASACPDAVESRYTELSLAYLRDNLIGFRRLFEGCGESYSGIGFDDWLRDVGAGDLAERMLAGLMGIEAALDRVPGSLARALVEQRDLPLAVHAAVKVVTDELKTEFVTVLNLELPSAAEGDND